jgi:hypothetical protein
LLQALNRKDLPMKSCLALLVLILILIFQTFGAYAQEKTLAVLTVEAGESERIDTPVCITLEWLSVFDPQALCLYEIYSNLRTPVPMQLEQGDGAKLC